MDDEEETYRLWKIRKTIMKVRDGVEGGAGGALLPERGEDGMAAPEANCARGGR